MTLPNILVVAKAPQSGRVKTRLGAHIGMDRAADLAAAALLDTLAAATDAVGAARCHLSLDGHLDHAVRGTELRHALAGWTVHPQGGGGFGARLADAHARVAGPVVQVGMDTPHLTPALLLAAAGGLDDHDAVLGPAEDGGWWVLGLRDPAGAAVLRGVPMSAPTTCADTRAALSAYGLVVGSTTTLRDVDEPADAEVVARLAPASRFARAWRRVAAA
jgi:rSAM/selenodomain-associated transferase 1